MTEDIMTNPTDDSHPSDLFEYRGVVCQLVYRYPWYAARDEPEQRLWGVVIYWPNGNVHKMARIHDTPEEAMFFAKGEIRRNTEETRGTQCPTTVATTD